MAPGDRPLRVWWYRGWCAVCRPCKSALIVDAPSWGDAFEVADVHAAIHREVAT